MGRWEPNARGRLEQAAMALYAERGFEQTTVAEIAARAGLTERTFFRHFTDKREVLFAGASDLQALLVTTLEATPESTPPLDAVALALEAIAEMIQQRPDFSGQRQALITANADLQERELIKLATLSSALAETLRGRGIGEPAASLTADAGIAIFRSAFERWVADPASGDFPQRIKESLDELRAVTGASPAPQSR